IVLMQLSFFFSSRRRHTRFDCDWSSDVCSSDLIAAYSASKHAVVGFTHSVAAEVAGTGVTVNAICPGYVDTDMTRQSVSRIAAKTGMAPEAALRAALDTSGQRRLIPPEEVARAVLALC